MTDKIRRTAAAVGLASLMLAGSAFAALRPHYRLLKSVVLGGDGGWDYLLADADSGRLYVTRGTKVVVLDSKSYKVIGEIPGVDGAHGVALAPDLGRGYASAGKAGAVVVFDLKTLKVLSTVPAGQNPDAIIYEPSTHRVFAFNGKSQDATAIDAVLGTVVGTIPMGGKPEFSATDAKGKVYVNVESTSELLSIDAATLKVEARRPLAPCEEPTGLAMDAKAGTLFAVCGSKTMAVVDAATGKVVASPAIGDHADAAAFDPGTGWAFSSNGDGTLTVVAKSDDGKWGVAQTVATRKGARTMALNAKNHRVYLVTADFGPAPEATDDQPHPRPSVKPGSFTLLVYGK
jgi:DNA-binding beta-propeller fold protein YncE